MQIIKKLNHAKFLTVIAIMLIFSACGGGGGSNNTGDTNGDGKLLHEIYSPYGQKLASEEDDYNTAISTTLSKTVIVTKYKEFGEKYDPSSLGIQAEPYCRIGGDYILYVENDPKVVGKYTHTNTLFECKTLQDLFSKIKIPSGWENDNLILYCNDGNLINFENINMDFLTTKVNNYKVCILKNYDEIYENTIIYGLDVGNPQVDTNENYFFSESTKKSPVLKDLKYLSGDTSGTMEYQLSNIEDSDPAANKRYYFRYDNTDKYFNLANTAKELTIDFYSIFPKGYYADIELSRIALFRSFSSGSKVFGYEKVTSNVISGSSSYKPFYTITKPLGLTQENCMQMLAFHNPSTSIGSGTKITCASDGNVMLNTEAIDGAYGKGSSISLFKNIILGLLDDDNIDTPKLKCQLPWGGYISEGESITAYKSDNGCGSCLKETRTCTGGTLSGTYTHQNCNVIICQDICESEQKIWRYGVATCNGLTTKGNLSDIIVIDGSSTNAEGQAWFNCTTSGWVELNQTCKLTS